jgi:hypothetical protein
MMKTEKLRSADKPITFRYLLVDLGQDLCVLEQVVFLSRQLFIPLIQCLDLHPLRL